MASWNQKAFDTVVAKYPDLEQKSESVAFIVWQLEQTPDIEPADLRAAGEKAGIAVAGRAVGSAREILGLKSKSSRKKKKKKKGAKRGTRKSGGKSSSASSVDGLAGMLDMLKGIEKQNQKLRGTLEKIRDVIDGALDG